MPSWTEICKHAQKAFERPLEVISNVTTHIACHCGKYHTTLSWRSRKLVRIDETFQNHTKLYPKQLYWRWPVCDLCECVEEHRTEGDIPPQLQANLQSLLWDNRNQIILKTAAVHGIKITLMGHIIALNMFYLGPQLIVHRCSDPEVCMILRN